MKFGIIVAIATMSGALSACATAGGGGDERGQFIAAYQALPDIDNQYMIDGTRVDPSRLEQAKADCIGNVSANPGEQAANGAVTGALVGVLLGAAVGGGTRYAGQMMARGAAVGAVEGGTYGAINGSNQRGMGLRNCLAGRGYRVLD